MNKLILLLPKQILNEYVIKHFSELSVEDFFEVSKKIRIPNTCFLRNNTLSENSSVLNYMLDIDAEAFRYFKQGAFSTECINKLADLEIKIYPEDIDAFPMLLDNNKLLERLIQLFPMVVKRLRKDQITAEIIAILEKVNFYLDEEDIEKYPMLCKSEKLLTNAVRNKPNLILNIKNLSENLVLTAIHGGFIPEKQHFYSNPQFKMYNILLQKAFENDPSVIVLFDKNKLDAFAAISAYSRGYVATEKDLIENPGLCRFYRIMEPAIMANPKVIVLTSEECYINYNIVSKA